jgi:hypothetical protein
MERSQAFLILSCVALLQLPDQACQATAQFPSNFNGGVRGCFAKTNEIVDGTFGLKLVLQNTCNGHLQGLTAIFDVRGTALGEIFAFWINFKALDTAAHVFAEPALELNISFKDVVAICKMTLKPRCDMPPTKALL